MTPEQICTGINVSESEAALQLVIHLDEEALESATARVPLEEVFAADISADTLSVFLRGDSFSICAGRLTGKIVPERSTWQIANVRRRNLPEGCNVKSPAFYNPALRITLAKARESYGNWDEVFQDYRCCPFGLPRDRIDWDERVRRCYVLSPSCPNNRVGKAQRAQDLVKKVETSQDLLLNRVILLFHLEDKLLQLCLTHRLYLHDLFSMRVGARDVQVNFVADSEYPMCFGGLGGCCVPEASTWEIFVDEGSGQEKDTPHPVLKLGLAKADNSRGRWQEVFTKWQPWQSAKAMVEAQALEGASSLAVEDKAGACIGWTEFVLSEESKEQDLRLAVSALDFDGTKRRLCLKRSFLQDFLALCLCSQYAHHRLECELIHFLSRCCEVLGSVLNAVLRGYHVMQLLLSHGDRSISEPFLALVDSKNSLQETAYSHEEQLLLAEALLQETCHDEVFSNQRNRRTDIVSTDFMTLLSAQVDSLVLQSAALTDVCSDEVRRPTSAESTTTSPAPSPGALSFSTSPRSPSPASAPLWSIKRPETHKLGSHYTQFGPPPRSQRRSPTRPQSPSMATYERNVEFIKQKQARLETAQKEKDNQEKLALVPPNITAESRKLVAEGYYPPWSRKGSITRSVIRNRKVIEDVNAKKSAEDAEHTFQPTINKRSQAIFRHVLDAGEPWHDRVHQRPKTRGVQKEEHSFRPQISRKAQLLQREGDITERLYRREAKAPETQEPSNKSEMRAMQRRMLAKELEKIESLQVKEEDEVAVLEELVRKFTSPGQHGVSKLAAALLRRKAEGRGAVEAEQP
ncbi:DED1 [Symbiodinium pilosum]|uniref:DED1 protein n=1 Tax=Symbiodinium pilosum TaxID=2952 RepID=A0A812M8Z2_SYMPI|nr:DED1 [Symbiodinium pilosum]